MLAASLNASAQKQKVKADVAVPAFAASDSAQQATREAKTPVDSVITAQDSLNLAKLNHSLQPTQKKKRNWATWKPDTKRAMWLALVLPGAGQIYNRKYWKLPIVYAGYAALIYAIIYTNGKYSDYRKAYISIADEDESTNTWQKYIPAGQTVENVDTGWLTNALNQRYMRFRRYRDLSIIGIVAWYGLSIIDAFVDAQLFNFDITPDLSLRVEPEIKLNDYRNVGVNCTLSF